MNNRFDFLGGTFPKIAEYGRKAEESLAHDNNICLLNLGRIGEAVTESLCHRHNINYSNDIHATIHELSERGIISDNICLKISALIDTKDDAVNCEYSSESAAARLLTTAQELCEWLISQDGVSKFGFLEDLFPANAPFPTFADLAGYGREAEENLYSNTRYCLMCLGDIGEAVVDFIMHKKKIHLRDEDYIGKIKFLFERDIINKDNSDRLHELRIARNKAAHRRYDSEEEGRTLLEKALALCEWVFVSNISQGDFIRGSISRISESGLDVLVGKIKCSVPRKEVPSELFLYHPGERKTFRVISRDKDKIILTLSQIYADPWNSIERRYEKYSPGQILTVTVVRIFRDTGASVEIASSRETVTASIPESEYDENLPLKVGSVVKAQVKRCTPREYPYLILSVKNVEQNDTPSRPDEWEEQSRNSRNSAMSDAEFRAFCKNAAYEQILSALDDGANPNAKNNNGMTALMTAAANNKNPRVINALLDSGAELEARDQYGNTALIFAAMYNTPEIVKALCSRGADVDALNHDKKKALDFALENDKLRDTEIIEILTSDEAEDDITPESEEFYGEAMTDSEFFELCQRGTDDEIINAINNGANVNAASRYGTTALMELAKHAGPDAIREAIAHGADVNAVNAKGNTALILAVMQCKGAAVRELLKHDPDVNAANKEGETALTLSAPHGENLGGVLHTLRRASDKSFIALCKEGVEEKILDALSHGVNPNAKTLNAKTTVLMLAAKNSTAGAVKALIDSGADITAQDKDGRTALDYAKENADLQSEEILALLGEEPAQATPAESEELVSPESDTPSEIEQPEEVTETPAQDEQQDSSGQVSEQEKEIQNVMRMTLQKDFLKICRSGTEDDISQALDAGVDVHVRNKDGASALMFAAQSNTAEAVDLLLRAGADVNAQDKHGNTALIYAASYNTDDVVNALLNSGAAMAIMNNAGYKALDYARRNYRLDDSDALAKLEGFDA